MALSPAETSAEPTEEVTAPDGTATTVEELPPGFWDDDPRQGPGQRAEPEGKRGQAEPGGDDRSGYVGGEGNRRKGGRVEEGRVGAEPGGNRMSPTAGRDADTHPLFGALSEIFPGRIVALERLDAETARDDDTDSEMPDDEPEPAT